MIQVPGRAGGSVAVRTLLGAGLNVHITLLCDIEEHRRVIDAYLGAHHDTELTHDVEEKILAEAEQELIAEAREEENN